MLYDSVLYKCTIEEVLNPPESVCLKVWKTALQRVAEVKFEMNN